MEYTSDFKYHFSKRYNIGIIGCGIRVRGLLDSLRELSMNTHIVAVCDQKGEEVLSQLREDGENTDSIKLFCDADEMLNSISLDGVIIGTRSDTHVFFAKKVIARNIPLLLEKPITTSLDELKELRNVYSASEKRVMVSFPLRMSPITELVREIVTSGKIGTVEHVQAVNYVPYGGVYYHNWYRSAGFGGLFFEKSTHDFDYINYLLDMKPVQIAAMVSNQVFGGNHPAGKICAECDEQLSCGESPFIQKNFALDNPVGNLCAFGKDVENHDSAGVLIRYESGMHANYAENFFVRKGAGARGARLSGYRGTLDFDFYTNQVTVHIHHTPRVDTYKFDNNKMRHFGGDKKLMFEFIQLMNGDSTISSTLDAGFISTLMCIAARKSAADNSFVSVAWQD